jgi:hypothetical protein
MIFLKKPLKEKKSSRNLLLLPLNSHITKSETQKWSYLECGIYTESQHNDPMKKIITSPRI